MPNSEPLHTNEAWRRRLTSASGGDRARLKAEDIDAQANYDPNPWRNGNEPQRRKYRPAVCDGTAIGFGATEVRKTISAEELLRS
ncbi:MAG: hypothetical protein ACHQRJ_05070 [Alphaproteobacteria bacterium]